MKILNTLTVKKIEGNKEFNYLYRTIESTLNGTKVYGIEIERIDITNDIVSNIERNAVKFISPKKEKIINLANLLCKNEVSPIHLVDIIGEYVDNAVISDFDKIVV